MPELTLYSVILDVMRFVNKCSHNSTLCRSAANTVLGDLEFLQNVSAELSDTVHICFSAHRVNGVQQILHMHLLRKHLNQLWEIEVDAPTAAALLMS